MRSEEAGALHPAASREVSAVLPADLRDNWRAQSCDDTTINGLDHARFALSTHAGHGCAQFDAAMSRATGEQR